MSDLEEVVHWDADGVRALVSGSAPFTKKPNPVYMSQMSCEFTVQTTEGVMKGHNGDWLAYDPMSGHAWVVTDDYKRMHYNDPQPTGHAG